MFFTVKFLGLASSGFDHHGRSKVQGACPGVRCPARARLIAQTPSVNQGRPCVRVYFRFYQGTGPSEAVALKWGGVDLLSGKATFTVSRHLGEENAPKTRANPQNGDATIQGTLRVLEIRPRPFYNTRHTYISIALTLGCNQKDRGVNRNQHCDDSGNYGKYIRDDGDLLLRAYR